MARDDHDRRALRALFERFKQTKRPFERGVELWGADVDLWEEDSYLAGLVDTFIARRRIEVTALRLDRTIDARLHQARAYAKSPALIEQWIGYRRLMLELAEALSWAASVPIVWSDGAESH